MSLKINKQYKRRAINETNLNKNSEHRISGGKLYY